jgi:mRNA-degrading endonuclease RelE of RelBE toxin-antitoxin system
MQVIFDEDARRDMKKMGQAERILFYQHIKKLAETGPRRHFSHGIDAYKENVGADGRMVFAWDDDEETLRILRCFTDHKDYEKWYKSYKK